MREELVISINLRISANISATRSTQSITSRAKVETNTIADDIPCFENGRGIQGRKTSVQAIFTWFDSADLPLLCFIEHTSCFKYFVFLNTTVTSGPSPGRTQIPKARLRHSVSLIPPLFLYPDFPYPLCCSVARSLAGALVFYHLGFPKAVHAQSHFPSPLLSESPISRSSNLPLPH